MSGHLVEEAKRLGAKEIGPDCTVHVGYPMDVKGANTGRWGHLAIRPDGQYVICNNGEVLYRYPREGKFA